MTSEVTALLEWTVTFKFLVVNIYAPIGAVVLSFWIKGLCFASSNDSTIFLSERSRYTQIGRAHV